MEERESSLDERLRKDQEIAEENKQRQIRLGHVPSPEPEEPESKPKSKPKSSKSKSSEKK